MCRKHENDDCLPVSFIACTSKILDANYKIRRTPYEINPNSHVYSRLKHHCPPSSLLRMSSMRQSTGTAYIIHQCRPVVLIVSTTRFNRPIPNNAPENQLRSSFFNSKNTVVLLDEKDMNYHDCTASSDVRAETLAYPTHSPEE